GAAAPERAQLAPVPREQRRTARLRCVARGVGLLSHERCREEEPNAYAGEERNGSQGRHERLRMVERRSISRATTGGKPTLRPSVRRVTSLLHEGLGPPQPSIRC